MPDVEIVVTATIKRDGIDPATFTYTGGGDRYLTSGETGGGGSSTSGSGGDLTASVNVDVKDQNNLLYATIAAQNVARAIAKIKDILEDVPPDTPIRVGGHTITAGEVLADLANTRFVVTDTGDFRNGGVGASDRSDNGGPHIDYLNFAAFDGFGDNDYAHPNYVDDAGLKGIILHELGHINADGESMWNSSLAWYKKEMGSLAGFYGSEYAQNLEMFANDFAKSVADAVYMNIGGYNPATGYGHQDPSVIYYDNVGDAPVYTEDTGLLCL